MTRKRRGSRSVFVLDAFVIGARAGAQQRFFDRNIEKKRQIRFQIVGGELDDLVDYFFVETASRALIGGGRVGVAVGNDDAAFG